MSSISATVCLNSIEKALRGVKEESFQNFLREPFIDPASKEISPDSNEEKILAEVRIAITKEDTSGEICFITDYGKRRFLQIKGVIEKCQPQLDVQVPREGVLVITLLSRRVVFKRA
jgi:hypothetical protein